MRQLRHKINWEPGGQKQFCRASVAMRLKQNQNSYTRWHAPTVAFSQEKAALQALGEGTGILVLL
jgi:hypothetical protein